MALDVTESSYKTISVLMKVNTSSETQHVEKDEACFNFKIGICCVLIGILCVLGLSGNITSFFVLWKHKTETATIFLLQVLAVCDSILLIISFFIYTLVNLPKSEEVLKSLSNAAKEIQDYIWPLALIAHTVTIYITVLVTLNRYYAISIPMQGKPIKSFAFMNNTKLQLILVLIFAVVYNIPRFFEHHQIGEKTVNSTKNGVNKSESNFTVEAVHLGDSKLYQIIYSNILYFPVMYIVPLVSLFYLNVKLIKGLKALKRRKEALTGHRQKDDNITIVIIVIVFVFILCQTPALANQILWAVTVDNPELRKCGHFHFYYTLISDALVVLNSSTNFLVYCLFGKTFRKVFRETLCDNRFFNNPSQPPAAAL